MDREEFLNLPIREVGEIVRGSGPQVCVFPFNGTRRWYMLEHAHENHADPAQAYVDLTRERYIEMYRMLFEHGLDTVIAPVFGGDIMERGDEYMQHIGSGLSQLAEHADFQSFYKEYGVGVHFYGDYRKAFSGTHYDYLLHLFDELTQDTAGNGPFRLFYGVYGCDATETIAELALQYHQKVGQVPTRRELIKLYYGEYIEKATLFIGFEKFSVFDYPLLGRGDENLYFTAAPSLYMSMRQLRSILYDHIYLRPVKEPDYFTMPKEDFESMRCFYEVNRNTVFGIGEVRGEIWYSKSIERE